MKACLMVGSPRRLGNSQSLAQRVVERWRLGAAGHDGVIHRLGDIAIGPCLDCRECKRGAMVCGRRDDMQALYPALEAADLLVWVTPIYWYGPSAQTKLLLDRLRPYFGNRKLQGKPALALLVAGSGAGDCDLTADMFARMCRALGIHLLGTATARAYECGDVDRDAAALAECDALVERALAREGTPLFP